jgi:superkiller protein 3
MSAPEKQKKKELQLLLKQAKKELMNEDFDECISVSKSILKKDKSNFYAYMFMGKALQMKLRADEALKSYIKACEINPDETLVWKGQLSIRVKDSDFVAFFETLTELAKLLVFKHDPLTEVVDYIKEYISEHGLIFAPLAKYYYRQIIPGLSELGDIVGYQVDKPSESLKKLLSIVEDEENKEINSIKDKAKITFPIGITERVKNERFNQAIWPCVSQSEIPQLYELLIDLEQDDNSRYAIQDKYLKYKYNMLRMAPANEKESLRESVQDILDGLVLIRCPVEFAWKLYFDWMDPASFDDLDLENMVQYINIFGKERSYGAVFYSFLISDICPFDKTRVVDYLMPVKKSKRDKNRNKKSKDTKEEPQPIATQDDDETNLEKDEETAKHANNVDERYHIFDVPPQEFLTKMYTALQASKLSILCNRIVLDYSTHMKDYVLGLEISESFTRAIVDMKFKTGMNMPNSKLNQTLNLAIIYTYFEAPKNYPKAMAMYESIERKHPDNLRIKVGKALILVETKKFQEASSIFESLIEEDPQNVDAIQELGWCQLHLKNYEAGRANLNKAINILSSSEESQGDTEKHQSANTIETASRLIFRLAASYYMELEDDDAELDADHISTLVNNCTSSILKCLKLSPNYAPAFTILGLIYYNYANKKDTAIKCFYKAFQIDPSQIEASYKLAEHFVSTDDWEMADIVSKAVIENNQAKRELNSKFSKIQDRSWPYRILGCAAMEFKDDVKAVEFFQSALRMNPADISSWIGLGEAYISCGRLEASVKVFNHVIRLQNDVSAHDAPITPEMETKADWHAVYLLASSLTSMFEFDESVRVLKNLLLADNGERHKDNICVLTLLVETLVLRCGTEINKGAVLRASDTMLEAFDYIFHCFKIEMKSIKLWRCLSDLFTIALTIRSSIERVPYSEVNALLELAKGADYFESNELWSAANMEGINASELTSSGKFTNACHYYFALSTIAAYNIGRRRGVNTLSSGLIFNIALSFISWFKDEKLEVYRDVSIKLLNKAIAVEPENSEYWNCLGIMSLEKNAKVSQHCFIKAISIESKNAEYWFNLGILYIRYFDHELANECFVRCQSIAAATPTPWLGLALVNADNADKTIPRNLFTHSYVLSKGSNPSNTLLYAVSVLDSVMTDENDERDLEAIQQLTSVNYGMMNYMKLYPGDVFALELSINIIERLYSFEKGLQYSEKLCSLLEKKYEELESEEVLISYCKAKCQMSRLLLANKEYSKSFAICEEVGSLLDSVEDLSLEVQRCMLSCFTILGLSLYFQGEFDGSLAEFKKLMDAFPENKHIVVLISQVLYASNDAEAKQAAMDELLNNVAEQGTSLVVAMTIAAISLVENLDEYIDAVKEVLDELPLETLIKDTYKEVPQFLTSISNKIEAMKGSSNLDHSNERVDKIWQRNAMLFPGDHTVWSHLDKEVSLELSMHTNKESAFDVGAAYTAAGRLRETQRGIILSGGVSEEGLAQLATLAVV